MTRITRIKPPRIKVAKSSIIYRGPSLIDGAPVIVVARVIKSIDEIVKGKEINCPASAEAGFRTTCNDCGLCAGNTVKAKSIAIVDHGPMNRKAIFGRVASINS